MVAVYPPMKKKVSAAAVTSNPVATSSGNVVGPDAKITNLDWNGNIGSQLQAQNLYLGQPGINVTYNLANTYTNEELQVLGKILTKLSGKKFKDYETVRTELATNYAGVEGDFNQVVDAPSTSL